MNNWRIAFLVSLALLLAVVVSSGYIVLSNTVTSGHCYDNLAIINEDISYVSSAIKDGAKTIHDFDRELKVINCGHSIEDNTIRLQIAIIIFDNKGHFERIYF